jgi:hypothetical protein
MLPNYAGKRGQSDVDTPRSAEFELELKLLVSIRLLLPSGDQGGGGGAAWVGGFSQRRRRSSFIHPSIHPSGRRDQGSAGARIYPGRSGRGLLNADGFAPRSDGPTERGPVHTDPVLLTRDPTGRALVVVWWCVRVVNWWSVTAAARVGVVVALASDHVAATSVPGPGRRPAGVQGLL